MIQLIYPNLSTEGISGYCLKFVGDAYATKPRPFDSAQEAWDGAKYKHTDKLPDVAVPVFFSWYGSVAGVKANYGDVAIWVPNRGVYGTPIRGDKDKFRWDKTVEDRARVIGGGKYLGWTEDLNGVRLVTEEEEVKIGNTADWRWRMNRLHHQLVGNWDMSDEVFKDIQGAEFSSVVFSWSDHPNAQNLIDMQVVGETATKDNWPQQIFSLQSQLQEKEKELEAVKENCNNPVVPINLQPGVYKVT